MKARKQLYIFHDSKRILLFREGRIVTPDALSAPDVIFSSHIPPQFSAWAPYFRIRTADTQEAADYSIHSDTQGYCIETLPSVRSTSSSMSVQWAGRLKKFRELVIR